MWVGPEIKKIENVLQKVMKVGFKLNKEFFKCTETQWLDFWVSKDRVRILASKVGAINQFTPQPMYVTYKNN